MKTENVDFVIGTTGATENKEGIKMVRRVGELKSLKKLNLSTKTEAYLKNKFESLDETIFNGRITAYNLANHPERVGPQDKALIELAEALDKAGFIRHDFDEVSFRICALYRAVYETIELPESLEGFCNVINRNNDIRKDVSLGNERYESFVDPKEMVYVIERILANNLATKESVVMTLIFLNDKSIEEIVDESGLTYERTRQIQSKALRKLRLRRAKLPVIAMSLAGGDKTAEIIESIEEINEIRKREIELKNKLRSISRLPFGYAEKATDFLEEDSDPRYTETEIENLDFSVRTYNCLKRAGLNTLSDIIRYPKEDLAKIRNFGNYSMKEVEHMLMSLS